MTLEGHDRTQGGSGARQEARAVTLARGQAGSAPWARDGARCGGRRESSQSSSGLASAARMPHSTAHRTTHRALSASGERPATKSARFSGVSIAFAPVCGSRDGVRPPLAPRHPAHGKTGNTPATIDDHE